MTLSQINLSGSGFSTSGIATPVLVVPGEALTLTVKYSPTSTKASSGDISLVSAQGGITSVSVSGTVSQSGAHPITRKYQFWQRGHWRS